LKALLVNPRLPLSFWNFQDVLKIINKRAVYIPLGLITAAALMPRDWQLKLVDLNIQQLTEKSIRWADLVFIGAMIVQKESVREIVNHCHKLGKKVVVGGPLLHHGVDMEFSDIDYCVLNEAELTLSGFISDLKSGKPRRIYRADQKCDIRKTPTPRWDLLDLKRYASMSVQFSRGCPYQCEFCDIPVNQGRQFRDKTLKQVIHELSTLHGTGWCGRVFIADDNFVGNRPRLKVLLREIASWQRFHGHPFVFNTEASINLAGDRELIALMVEAGFKGVFIGLETPDKDTLRRCGKHQNCKVDLLEAVRTIQGNGLEVSGGFIVGFDSDSADIFDRQIQFIQESGIVTAMISILYALPGTALYQRLKKQGRLLDTTCMGSNSDGQVTFIPKMGIRALARGYLKVLNHIYSPSNYYERIFRFIEHYRPAKRHGTRHGDIASFLRSILYLGVLNRGNEKRFYWKAVLHGFFFRQKYIDIIIEQAVFANHFRLHTQRVNKALRKHLNDR
jgi:radical SAM superfamily enzyme YgiQ (UPF0313 family)